MKVMSIGWKIDEQGNIVVMIIRIKDLVQAANYVANLKEVSWYRYITIVEVKTPTNITLSRSSDKHFN